MAQRTTCDVCGKDSIRGAAFGLKPVHLMWHNGEAHAVVVVIEITTPGIGHKPDICEECRVKILTQAIGGIQP